MKKFALSIIFFTSFSLVCCKVSHPPVSSVTTATIDKMIEGWCSNLCDYPKSLEEFVSIYEDSDSWKETPMKDSVETTLSFLKKERNHIIWCFDHPTVTSMDLTVVYYNDTIYQKAGEWLFPGLDVSLLDYNKYYFEFPSSVEKLIAYDSLAKKDHDGFYQCCDVTFDYLLRNKDNLDWQVIDEERILIMSGNDTIAYQLGYYPQVFYCDDSAVSNKTIFRFFDNNGNYAHSKNVEKALKIGLSGLRKNYSITPFEQALWHIMVYTNENGLQPFCENDDLSLNTEWFHDVEDFMYKFCDEYSLGKVIFVSPSYQK